MGYFFSDLQNGGDLQNFQTFVQDGSEDEILAAFLTFLKKKFFTKLASY
jgi:hypothetical protein